MDKDKNIELIESIRDTVEQIRLDDIAEAPEAAIEQFQCQCCGEDKPLAGSLIYDVYLLCNDCVLVAEISFALKKIKDIEELLASMEDKRFENLYNSIFEKDENINN